MPQFRKLPVVINAVLIQAPTDETIAIEKWVIDGTTNGTLNWNDDGSVEIKTLEGTMKGEVGDWLIQGVKGELYPCKADIFQATYEF